jgi:hypothetical protein
MDRHSGAPWRDLPENFGPYIVKIGVTIYGYILTTPIDYVTWLR